MFKSVIVTKDNAHTQWERETTATAEAATNKRKGREKKRNKSIIRISINLMVIKSHHPNIREIVHFASVFFFVVWFHFDLFFVGCVNFCDRFGSRSVFFPYDFFFFFGPVCRQPRAILHVCIHILLCCAAQVSLCVRVSEFVHRSVRICVCVTFHALTRFNSLYNSNIVCQKFCNFPKTTADELQ